MRECPPSAMQFDPTVIVHFRYCFHTSSFLLLDLYLYSKRQFSFKISSTFSYFKTILIIFRSALPKVRSRADSEQSYGNVLNSLFRKFQRLADHSKIAGDGAARPSNHAAGGSGLIAADGYGKVARFNNAFAVVQNDGHLSRR